MAVLALLGVSAGYGRADVVHDVSLSLEAGEVVALIGPNGAGKTTLLRAAAGILRPTAGSVVVDGRDLAGIPPREAALLLSGVPQDDAAAFASRIVLLAGGRVAAEGPPGEVLEPRRLAEAFGADVLVLSHPDSGAPVVVPRDRDRA